MIRFARLLCLSLICLLAGSGCSKSKPELYVYIWSDYISSDVIKKFEKEYNCKVVVDTYDSNESMYAKLKLGAAGYDLLFPSNYILGIMHKEGMLQPINRELIPNAKYFDSKYQRFVNPGSEAYSLPYMMSYTGLIYRTDRIHDLKPSWGVFGRKDLRGRMTMLNDIRETLGAGLKYLGFSINTIDPNQITQARDVVVGWKKNLAKFESEQFKNGIASAEYLVCHGWNGDAMQLMQENDDVGFVVPEQGSVVSFDYMVIPHDARHVELAHKFMNFLYRPDNAAENMSFTYYVFPNVGAYPLLSEGLANHPILFPSQEILDRSEVILDLGPNITKYIKAWDYIKAAP